MKGRHFLDKCRRSSLRSAKKLGILSVTISTIISIVFVSCISFAKTEIDMGVNSVTYDYPISLEVVNNEPVAEIPETSASNTEGTTTTGNHGFFTFKTNENEQETSSIFAPVLVFLFSTTIIYLGLSKLKAYSWKTGKFASTFSFLNNTSKNPIIIIAIVFGLGSALPMFFSYAFSSIAVESTTNEIEDLATHNYEEGENPFYINFSAEEEKTLTFDEIAFSEEIGDITGGIIKLTPKTNNPTGQTFSINAEKLKELSTENKDAIPSIEKPMSFADLNASETAAFGFLVGYKTDLQKTKIDRDDAVIPANKLNDVLKTFTGTDEIYLIIATKTTNDTKAGTYKATVEITATTNSINEKFDYYTLTYRDSDGVTKLKEDKQLTYISAGRKFKLFVAPEKTGYTFKGWSTSILGNMPIDNKKIDYPYDNKEKKFEKEYFETKAESSILYAVYEKIEVPVPQEEYSIKFDTTYTYEHYEIATKAECTPKEPEEEPSETDGGNSGSGNEGSEDEETGNEGLEGEETGGEEDTEEETPICETYENPDTHEITYYKRITEYEETNGGTPQLIPKEDEISKVEDEPKIATLTSSTSTITLPTADDSIPQVSGFDFIGWATEANKREADYAYDSKTKTFTPSSISLTEEKKDITLYAVYKLQPAYYVFHYEFNNEPGCTISSSFEIPDQIYPEFSSDPTLEWRHAIVTPQATPICQEGTKAFFGWQSKFVIAKNEQNEEVYGEGEIVASSTGFEVKRDINDLKFYNYDYDNDGNPDKAPSFIITMEAIYKNTQQTPGQTSGLLSINEVRSILGDPEEQPENTEETIEKEEEEKPTIDEEAQIEKEEMRSAALARAAARRAKAETPTISPAVSNLVAGLSATASAIKDGMASATASSSSVSSSTTASTTTASTSQSPTQSSYTKPLGATENNAKVEENNNKNSLVTTICIFVIAASGLGIAAIIFVPLIAKNRHKKPAQRF